ncbi:MAG: ABC transporter ATP-binding protein [Bacteroidetes bacterium]|nr:MAG: ABC transporter ATP-binding protein [Bacteroidota bacterium]
MDIISAQNIVKRFHSHTALDEVNLSVPEKSVFGLLGPNGAGKTTLIRIINQITAPDSGRVFFAGEKLQPRHVEQIGYLPEERGLYKKMEVGEQCLYLAQLKGLSKNDAMKKLKFWFEKFEMADWWKKKVEELSKGMQQKVQFVVTVLHEPSVLILDEPFSGFDPINASLIKNEILRLKENGTTILLSTHNMSSVEELCDNIALVNKAKTILQGSVREIRQQYKANTYEVEFTGSIMTFTKALFKDFELLEKQEDTSAPPGTGSIHCKAKVKLLYDKSPNDLLNTVMPYVQILGFREILPSMNDIFISKVQEKEVVRITNLIE